MEYPETELQVSETEIARQETYENKLQTFTRSKFSDVTENLPLIWTRFPFDLSSKESLYPAERKRLRDVRLL